jgi:hypothetical protein
MDVQKDRSKDFGEIIANMCFSVGSCGPCDGTMGSPLRKHYEDICRAWIERGELPSDAKLRA